MKTKDMSNNGTFSEKRIPYESTAPSAGIGNVSEQDNGQVMMNKPEMDMRGSRADALIDIMNMDSERLGTEAPRMTKIKG